MKKLFFLTAVGIGYVLGARAGRERYEQIAKFTRTVKNNPTVQSTASSAADLAKDTASAAAGTVAEKVPFGSNGGGKNSDLESQLHPDSTARQDNPYPQGDLP